MDKTVRRRARTERVLRCRYFWVRNCVKPRQTERGNSRIGATKKREISSTSLPINLHFWVKTFLSSLENHSKCSAPCPKIALGRDGSLGQFQFRKTCTTPGALSALDATPLGCNSIGFKKVGDFLGAYLGAYLGAPHGLEEVPVVH